MNGKTNLPSALSHSSSSDTSELSRLALRFQSGIRSDKYRPVDYDQLRAIAHQKRNEGAAALLKVKRIENASRQSKENSMQQQHRAVWKKELSNLTARRRQVETELEVRMRMATEEYAYMYKSWSEVDSILSKQAAQFKKDTVDPIWNLKEDLQYWILQNRVKPYHLRPKEGAGKNSSEAASNLNESEEGELGDPDSILDLVESVKGQQKVILDRLEDEQDALEEELKAEFLMEASYTHPRTVSQGIPEEAFSLPCPDEAFKVAVLEEFLKLDFRYRERLEGLEAQRAFHYRTPLDGWSEKNHLLFTATVEQHPYDLPNRRAVYIDRLKKLFPHTPRKDLVMHEDWVLAEKHYHKRLRSLTCDWLRDRKELEVKAAVAFQDLEVACQLEAAKESNRNKQKELCNTLYEQLVVWRDQKIEALKLEQDLMEDKLRQETEEMAALEVKVEKRRAADKKKILDRQDNLDRQRKVREAASRKRLDALRETHREQAEQDKRRVQFREDEYRRKLLELREAEIERQREEEEKEERLEALRLTVRVQADADLMRTLGETKSWKHKRDMDQSVGLHQPLFDINTFTSRQISSDPRVKVEQKLRDAGLHHTDYARKILSQIKPAHPPRRDTEATHKFNQ